jgi:hypothetical protein
VSGELIKSARARGSDSFQLRTSLRHVDMWTRPHWAGLNCITRFETLPSNSGSVENLNVSAFHGFTPYRFHAAASGRSTHAPGNGLYLAIAHTGRTVTSDHAMSAVALILASASVAGAGLALHVTISSRTQRQPAPLTTAAER